MGVSQGDSKKAILSVNARDVHLEIGLLFSVWTSFPECTVLPRLSIFLLFISSAETTMQSLRVPSLGKASFS